METTTLLSTKGQIVVPKAIRESKGWKAGTEFTVEETPQGLLLRPKRKIKRTTLADLERFTAKHKWKGKPLSLKDMDKAIGEAVLESWARSERNARG
jgi:AbrB family looped-hinge helix DNA binding protein